MGSMTWPEAFELLQRYFGVAVAAAGFFRLSYEVSIWPTLLLVPVGLVLGGAFRDRNTAFWLLGTALVAAGLFGLAASFEDGSPWPSLLRSEPLGRTALVLFTALGTLLIVLKVSPRKQTDGDA
jgi:hypothetical protein